MQEGGHLPVTVISFTMVEMLLKMGTESEREKERNERERENLMVEGRFHRVFLCLPFVNGGEKTDRGEKKKYI